LAPIEGRVTNSVIPVGGGDTAVVLANLLMMMMMISVQDQDQDQDTKN